MVHAEAQQFHEPEATAVHEFSHQTGGTAQGGKQTLALVASEDGRYPATGRRALKRQLPQLAMQSLLDQEDDGIERLFLGRRAGALTNRESGQERADLGCRRRIR